METEILTQLIWIKWLLIFTVIVIAIAAASMVALAWFASKIPEQMMKENSFHDQAQALLDQGKSEELIGLAEERVSKFPADSYAYWFLGQACYRIGNLKHALNYLRKAQDIRPEWESTYTGPLVRVIEEKLAEDTGKPDLKLIKPNQSFEKSAPSSDGEPIV